MRFKLVAKLLGSLLFATAICMVLPLVVALLYGEMETVVSFVLSISITLAFSAALRWWGRGALGTVFRREAILVVAISWALIGAFGALPYLFDGVFTNPVDAYFESVSGLTTTGATVLTDIEGTLSHGMHFWRCFTHWLGGMGIVVLFVAIFPQLGVGGKLLFKSEVPGPITEGLRPKIKETSGMLYRIYIGLTLFCMLSLWLAGMDLFEAACHAVSTLGTGGFSTRNASIAGFDSVAIEMVTTVFMILAGINFALYFQAVRSGWKRAIRDRELWAYFGILVSVTILLTLVIQGTHGGLGGGLRYASFQVASIVSTTGFVTDDFDQYSPVGRSIFFVLFFMGGMAGSTAGGFKTIRIMILVKGAMREVGKVFRPQAISAVKIGRRTLDEDTIHTVFVYLALYIGIFAVSTLLMSTMMDDLVSAGSAVVVCLANVGPGLGDVGAVESFAPQSATAKLFLAGLMVLGRLELFTLLVLFSPSFWRR